MSKLPQHWQMWCHKRRSELISDGIPNKLAHEFATREARARAKVGAVVGAQAAASAKLVARHENGRLRLCLQGAWDDVPPEGRGTLQTMMKTAAASAE